MSLAIIGAACRPRNRKGEIMYDALPLIEQHGKERMHKGIRIPVGGTHLTATHGSSTTRCSRRFRRL
jgi:hypothetical protein